MKPILSLALSLIVTLTCFGQDQPTDNSTKPTPGAEIQEKAETPAQETGFVAKTRDAHSTVWEKVTYEPNPWGGQKLPHRHVVTELGAGLNYQTASGQWQPSQEKIEAVEGGAAAVEGRTKVRWATSLANDWPIQIESPDGKIIRSRVLGVTCFDATGKSVWLAEIKDVQGYITEQNEVTYPDCMAGIKASVRFTYTRAGLEQDLLIEESLDGLRPEDLGLDPRTAVIALVTEFQTPEAPKVSRIASAERQPEMLSDEAVDFGALSLKQGKAWLTGGAGNPHSVQVYKQWTEDSGRRFLFEKISFPEVEEMLNALPKYEGAAAHSERKRIQRLVSTKRTFPEAQKRASAETRKMQIAATLKDPVLIASLQPRKALLADYQMVDDPVYTDYTFTGEMTYQVSGPIEFQGVTRLEGGAVIKIDRTSNTSIRANNIVCDTRSYSPCIITSVDDDTVGEILRDSLGDPTVQYYGGIALDLTGAPSGTVLSNLRFLHLNTAVAGSGVVLRDCQVIRCNNAFSSTSTSPLLENVLLHRLNKFLPNTQPAIVTAVHVTGHNITTFLNNTSGSIKLTNCLFAAVGSWQCANTSIGNSVSLPSDTGLFQTVGAGSHYLADGSPHRDAGTAQLSASLLKSLAQKTTFPPTAFQGESLDNNQVLGPVAQRDTNQKDLGYHYDPLDYVFGGCDANENITFAPGTAVGWFRDTSDWQYAGHGIHIADQKILTFDGQPNAPCYWVRSTTVQEGYDGTWAGGYGPGGITGWAWPDVNNAPQLRARFLRASMLAGDGNHWRDDYGRLMVHVSDSEIYGGGMGGYIASYFLTNCLLKRTFFGVADGNTGVTINVRSCTFVGERFYMTRSYPVPVSVRDCAFDQTTFPITDSHAYNASVTDYDYNAYITGQNTLINSGTHNVFVTGSFNWQTGPLGKFYLPSGSSLVNTGSMTSAAARMYHYTTQANQSKEGNTQLDIGYHYLAVDSNGNPLDTDGDGRADYIEDPNGNGTKDAGETAFADPDTDYDGITDTQELTDGTDPLSPSSTSRVRLAYFDFNAPNWVGNRGQLPKANNLIEPTNTWSGSGLHIKNQLTSRLVYNDRESDGRANINLREGTVRFWFKPDWSSTTASGTGPQVWSRLIEVGRLSTGWGQWTVDVNPQGTQMRFYTSKAGSSLQMLMTPTIKWTAGKWYQIVLTYGPQDCRFYTNGVHAGTCVGVADYPDANQRQATGLSIGNDGQVCQPAKGSFEEMETFNYSMSLHDVQANYQAVMSRDSDHDGLPDVKENEIGTDPLLADSDGDGLPDGWEYAYGFDPVQSPTSNNSAGDPDNDGRKNIDEYKFGTDPLRAEDRDEQLVYEMAASGDDVINLDFAENLSQTAGPAAAGFNLSDRWNSAFALTAPRFRVGQKLVSASGTRAKASLWTFAGPFRLNYSPFRCLNGCHWNPYSGESAYNAFWGCWSASVFCKADRCRWMFIESYYGTLWSAEGGGLYNIPWSPYWTFWRHQLSSSSPVYFPAFDVAYPFDQVPDEVQGVERMATDRLITAALDDPSLCGAMSFLFDATQAYSQVFLTGLEPAVYHVFIYGGKPARINGSARAGSSVRWNTANGVSRKCYRYTVDARETGLQPPVYEFNDLLRHPVWLEEGPRIGMDFQQTARLAGIQVVKVGPVQQPQNVRGTGGKRSAYIAWDRTPFAESYDIFRSEPGLGFVRIGNTVNRLYTDAGLVPGRPYQYHVVAVGEFQKSTPSTSVTVTPYDGPENCAPILNSLAPLKLTMVDGGFVIPFIKLLQASDAHDIDGDPVDFVVDEVRGGALLINGIQISSKMTGEEENEKLESRRITPGSHVVWMPLDEVFDAESEVFTVRAYDGKVTSVSSAPVKIKPIPPTYLMGWGESQYGQLGDGEMYITQGPGNRYTDVVNTPGAEPTQDIPVKVKKVDKVVGGDAFVWRGAAVTADEKLWLWGEVFGVVAGKTSKSGWPIVTSEPFLFQTNDQSGVLGPFTGVTDVSISSWNALAIKKDGSLWSWGAGELLGREIPEGDLFTPWGDTQVPRQVKGFFSRDSQLSELKVKQALVDGLALCEDGSVWHWGQLGVDWLEPREPYGPIHHFVDVSLTEGADPMRPNRIPFFDNRPVAQIAACGGQYMALCRDGTVWEFGYVQSLRFKPVDASRLPPSGGMCGSCCYFSATPIQVPLPKPAKAIAAQGDYSVAVLEDGTVYHWGTIGNPGGQDFQFPDPVTIPGLKDIEIVTAGDSHCLAVDLQGQVWAWGNNMMSQCGPDLDYGVTLTPVLVDGLENAELVFASDASFAVASLPENGRPRRPNPTAMDKQVRLDWATFPGAVGYKVYRSEILDGLYLEIGAPVANSFLDTDNLINGNVYFYCVSAITDAGETPRSQVVSAVPLPAPPQPTWHDVPAEGDIPAIPAVLGRCRSIRLQWNDLGSVASGYRIYRASTSTGPYTLIAEVKDAYEYSDFSTGGQVWFYKIAAFNTAGESAHTEARPAQIAINECAPAPQNVRVAVDNNGIVTVSWDPVIVTIGSENIEPEAYMVKWALKKKPLADAPLKNAYTLATSLVSTGSPNVRSYTFDGETETHLGPLLNSVLCWFKVSAVFRGEEGIESALAGPVIAASEDRIPGVPSNLAAHAGCGQVFLEWSGDDKTEYYKVQYRQAGQQQWSEITTWDCRFWHEGLLNQTQYEYRVIAFGMIGDLGERIASDPTAIVSATTLAAGTRPPDADFTVSAQAYDGMVYLQWPNLNALYPYRGFTCFLERKLAGAPDSSYEPITGTAPGTGFVDREVVNETEYTYRVNAYDTLCSTTPDSRFYRISRTVNARPTASDTIGLLLRPGNGYVTLDWEDFSGAAYKIKHSLKPGGPYEIVDVVRSGTSFTHAGLENNVDHYYKLVVMTTFGEEKESPEQFARPMATLRPMTPTDFRADLYRQNAQGTFQDMVSLLWNSSIGASEYRVSLAGTTDVELYRGPLTSFIYTIPSGTAAGATLNFKVVAVAGQNEASDPARASVVYSAPATESSQILFLSVAGQEIVAGGNTIDFRGPTNLVLHASMKTMSENLKNMVVSHISFFADGQLIGRTDGEQGDFLWRDVPGGTHQLHAVAVAKSATPATVNSASFESAHGVISVEILPEVTTYQTSASDLQLPAPGLQISLERSYDSRQTASAGTLGVGWSASWDRATLSIAAPLHQSWIEGPFDVLRAMHCIGETESHLITITLPDGSTAYFAPTPVVMPDAHTPYDYDDDFGAVGMKFVPCSLGEGTLRCETVEELCVVSMETNPDSFWDGDHIELHIPRQTQQPLQPSKFIYTSPDGVEYVYQNTSATRGKWRVTSVTDRNGNSLTYAYTLDGLQSIKHSSRREVTFEYDHQISGKTWIYVRDTIGGEPVVKYCLEGGFLTEVHKLVKVENNISTYESNRYEYGSSPGNDENRLTKVYDPRGLLVLRNAYGQEESSGTPDGRLVSQTDVLDRITYYVVDPNDQVAIETHVGGNLESVVIQHTESGAISSIQQGDAQTSFEYDRGLLKQTINASGKARTYGYDNYNRLVSESDELNNTTSVVLNEYGQPTSTQDAKGKGATTEYDDHGNPVSNVDIAGATTVYAYHPTKKRDGNIVLGGMLASETRGGGISIATVSEYQYYDDPSNLSSVLGDLKTVIEKAAGTDAGIKTEYEYDRNGNRTKETREGTVRGASADLVTSYQYDRMNRVIQTTDPLSRVSTTQYDKLGKPAVTTDVFGRQTRYTNDVMGNLIQTLYADGTVTRTVYDEKNRAVLSQDRVLLPANGITEAFGTKTVYDISGRVEKVERRAGVQLKIEELQLAAGLKLPNAEKQYRMSVLSQGTVDSFTRSQYDADGRLVYSVDKRGLVTKFKYDDAGRRIQVRVYPNYQAPSGQIELSDEAGTLQTTSHYDANGNQDSTTDAAGNRTDFVYDDANRLVQTVFPMVTGDTKRKSRTTFYDRLGRRTREIDEAGVATRYSYDFRGLLQSVILDSDSPITAGDAVQFTYAYDQSGNLISQTDFDTGTLGERTTTYQYDELGRRTKRTLPDGSFEVATHPVTANSDGTTVSTKTDFRGLLTITTFDKSDRILHKVLPGARAGEVSYNYSDDGLLTSVTMSGQVDRNTYYAYDTQQRLRKKFTPEGVVTYTYYPVTGDLESIKAYQWSKVDADGEPGTATPDVSLTYRYDIFGRLESVTDWLPEPKTTAYHYDAVGNLDYFTYTNGVKHDYTYTEQNRLKTLVLTRGDNSRLRGFDYTLDPNGQRLGVVETEGNSQVRRRVEYQYDSTHGTKPLKLRQLKRLTREMIFTGNPETLAGYINHTYSRAGNRTERSSDIPLVGGQTLTFDPRDRISNAQNAYDANGNTVKDEAGFDTGDLYDAENHLIARVKGSLDVNIVYDHDGNRVAKRLNPDTTDEQVTQYILDDRNPTGYMQVLAEYTTEASTPMVTYAYGLDLISQTASSTTSGTTTSTTHYYGCDGQGSVRMLLDENTAITDTYDFDAYGILLQREVRQGGVLVVQDDPSLPTGTPNHYLYTGEQWDSDLGMYFLRARYYNPKIGRFWTMDSYEGNNEDPQSLHKYIYCRADPANGIDPSGLTDYDITIAYTGDAVLGLAAFGNGLLERESFFMDRKWICIEVGPNDNVFERVMSRLNGEEGEGGLREGIDTISQLVFSGHGVPGRFGSFEKQDPGETDFTQANISREGSSQAQLLDYFGKFMTGDSLTILLACNQAGDGNDAEARKAGLSLMQLMADRLHSRVRGYDDYIAAWGRGNLWEVHPGKQPPQQPIRRGTPWKNTPSYYFYSGRFFTDYANFQHHISTIPAY